MHAVTRIGTVLTAVLVAAASAGCRSPGQLAGQADETGLALARAGQERVTPGAEPFSLDAATNLWRHQLMAEQGLPGYRPDGLPAAPGPSTNAVSLSLGRALEVAARNSREYQSFKEDVFLAALGLDLKRDDFRNSYIGALSSLFSASFAGEDSLGVENGADATAKRKFAAGAELSTHVAVDLVKLLTLDRSSSLGLLLDASISLPLLRGAGRLVVLEPVTQAERNLFYVLRRFERFKKSFAVSIATGYLNVLEQRQVLDHAISNAEQLVLAGTRARRLADAGRLPEFQVDQARQDMLRARTRVLTASQSYEQALDTFKMDLGLPPDALIELQPAVLARLAELTRSRLAADQAATQPPAPDEAVRQALEQRLDLQNARDAVDDARRAVEIARNGLKAGLTLTASGGAGESRALGSADQSDAELRLGEGSYRAELGYEAPWERTGARNAYRESQISLDRGLRGLEEAEDQVKLSVRSDLRSLVEARESFRIQEQAVELARRRVDSTELSLQAGRAEIRDVLDAREALVSAQDSLTAALVAFQQAELRLGLDTESLDIGTMGAWDGN